jgi:hypothetical protein
LIVLFELTVRHAPADLSLLTHPLICAHVERNAKPTQPKKGFQP